MSNESSADDLTRARLSAYEAAELPAEERREVEPLLLRSEEARQVLARLRRLREMNEALQPAPLAAGVRRALGDRLEEALTTQRRRRWGMGATLVATAAAAALLLFARYRPSPPPALDDAKAPEVVQTGPTEHQLVSLGDRAVAFVGAQTEVRVWPDPQHPLEVRQGTVRLVVRRDLRNPFVVRTAAAEVAVLGTEFDVDVADDTTNVRVVRGEVEVRNARGRRRVWAREAARARATEEPRLVLPVRAVVVDGPGEIDQDQKGPGPRR